MFNFGFLSKAERKIRDQNIDDAVGYLATITNPKATENLVQRSFY